MQSSTSSSSTPSSSNPLPTVGSNAVDILINDHQVIKGLLNQLTSSSEDGTRLAVLEQLKAALVIHDTTEETFVYPAIRVVADKKSEAMKLYNETAEADVLVFKLDTMLKTNDTADFQKTAKTLQAAILEHIDDEENDAFKHLQKHADPQQQALLTQSVQQFRSSFTYSPQSSGRVQIGDISTNS